MKKKKNEEIDPWKYFILSLVYKVFLKTIFNYFMVHDSQYFACRDEVVRP